MAFGLSLPLDYVLLLMRSAALSLMRIPAADEEVEFELNVCLLLVVSKVNLVKLFI